MSDTVTSFFTDEAYPSYHETDSEAAKESEAESEGPASTGTRSPEPITRGRHTVGLKIPKIGGFRVQPSQSSRTTSQGSRTKRPRPPVSDSTDTPDGKDEADTHRATLRNKRRRMVAKVSKKASRSSRSTVFGMSPDSKTKKMSTQAAKHGKQLDFSEGLTERAQLRRFIEQHRVSSGCRSPVLSMQSPIFFSLLDRSIRLKGQASWFRFRSTPGTTGS